jgi:murein DD-endopeptidase MepM/ murein hydrolase activator NlpD
MFKISFAANNVFNRFSTLPSIWPLHGSIRADYGWRTHPILGTREFHKGIDIPGWVGAPVRAAADGLVVFSDWSKGYGLAVIIDHHNGYSTLYGHNQKLMVSVGDVVRKGQQISQVGNTGLSTGPHVHYEVNYNKSAMDPKNFLDLNMFSSEPVKAF